MRTAHPLQNISKGTWCNWQENHCENLKSYTTNSFHKHGNNVKEKEWNHWVTSKTMRNVQYKMVKCVCGTGKKTLPWLSEIKKDKLQLEASAIIHRPDINSQQLQIQRCWSHGKFSVLHGDAAEFAILPEYVIMSLGDWCNTPEEWRTQAWGVTRCHVLIFSLPPVDPGLTNWERQNGFFLIFDTRDPQWHLLTLSNFG